jgi:hypothetical protein
MTFSATLPVKPSVTTTSATPAVNPKPSTFPTKSNDAPARSDRVACAATTSSRPRPASVPFDSSPTRGPGDAEHRGRQRGAHERELHEVLGPDGVVGADVEQRDRRAGDGHADGEGRAVDARRALDVEQARREGGPGRAAGDEGVRAPLGDRSGGLDDGRVGVPADGARGLGVLRDRDGRVDALDAGAAPRPASTAAGPNATTRIPPAAACVMPATTAEGSSAPATSTAMTGERAAAPTG